MPLLFGMYVQNTTSFYQTTNAFFHGFHTVFTTVRNTKMLSLN